ncbi:phage tail sheath C-terminal domain-containing protein [Undibacterium sp. Ji49W]|uniref:phage tail sheath C-terminal domain-containing protein n=1 Tax=Undibacterium sp. Ji49W TaxID=3413040 RepID=UPI003BF0FAAF
MSIQETTPGVVFATEHTAEHTAEYSADVASFTGHVVQAATGIPLFIGYTQTATEDGKSIVGQPISITSLEEYARIFGGAAQVEYDYVSLTQAYPPYAVNAATPAFLLYPGLQMFFSNGGGTCYVLSLGTYADVISNGSVFSKEAYTAALAGLAGLPEPDTLVLPDAVYLALDDWASVSQTALRLCSETQNLVYILDVLNGYLPSDGSSKDPITGGTGNGGFYKVAGLGEDFNQYGVSYYPWLNTNVVSVSSIDYTWISAASLPQFSADLATEALELFALQPADKLQAYLTTLVDTLAQAADPATVRQRHLGLQAASPLYRQTMQNLATSVNLLPPSSALAGVYTRNDATSGVFHAPANTSIINAISPAVMLDDSQQAKINVPLNGLAVNAIRVFPNFGMLIWGARTMAGNSDDWRYLNFKRIVIMLDKSIRTALKSYAFSANDHSTWSAVTASINSFLTAQWKAGCLVGSSPAEAFSVIMGMGSSMTTEDILQGMMRVSIKVALTMPAEFIILEYEQQVLAPA